MASIHRKAGASGKVSPYWQAKFRGPDGRVLWKTTKQSDSRKAAEVARVWEKAARLANRTELTQVAGIQLLDALIEATSGERFQNQTVEDYFGEWTAGKATTGAARSTLTRYRPVLAGF
ncbi:MAG TPA: hypothetical protein VGD78_17670, partial [Chthoniobacterales bacterium]